ncbi:glycosyltransferase family 61 protein [Planktothrix sp. FACHB-1355]|uniref:Glycosyltransferase family 61 protein n=2 Tax=Aerosakkonema funiforme TaxID=1246630 RepID=A0A926ZFL5_9CYAN|nr:glycosyltransferase family 61 protein [Planktothrix sp. FACHB-1355]MBD2180980.1 glycosyltransferase family 61 protein [Aerosakkonema funiforme FACHB-1375]MBD3560252.1 glycosyltransferase family 61 protein [Planktothrix sp. FACHB-1355]
MIEFRTQLVAIHRTLSWNKQWPPQSTINLEDLPTARQIFDAEDLIVPEGKLISSNSETTLPASKLYCPAAWAARIPKGASVGGTVLTPDNQAVITSMESWQDHGPPNNWLLPISRRNHHLTGSCLDIGKLIWATNYFHFLIDALPHLAILGEAEWEPDWILVYQRRSKFVDAIFQKMGLDKKIVYTSIRERYEADEMLVCTMPNQRIGKYEYWGMNFLSQVFKPEKESKKIRLFIDRSGTAVRKLRNQAQMLEQLSKYNFVTVRLEEKTIQEQVNLFHNAEVIIAPHGAGLSNIAFCQPNTKIIELFSPEYVQTMYRKMAARLQLPWLGVLGKGEMLYPDSVKRNILYRDPSLNKDIILEPELIDRALAWAFEK